MTALECVSADFSISLTLSREGPCKKIYCPADRLYRYISSGSLRATESLNYVSLTSLAFDFSFFISFFSRYNSSIFGRLKIGGR